MLVTIAIPRVKQDTFVYDAAAQPAVAVGDLVRVELRRRSVLGLVCARGVTATVPTKPVLERVVPGFLGARMLDLLTWVADYYLTPLGIVFGHAIPPPVWRRFRAAPPAEPAPDRVAEPPPVEFEPEPDPERRWAGWRDAVAETCAAGRSVLFLCPDDAGRAFWGACLRSSGQEVVEYHSDLAPRVRVEAWTRLRAGRAVVLGNRSAVFAPLPDLGLVVVDAEHDDAYKNKQQPHEHARDVAVMRSRFDRARVILASPWPTSETYYQVQAGHYRATRPLAGVRSDLPLCITDMEQSDDRSFSAAARELIRSATTVRRVLLVHNRRGYSAHLRCRDCGYVPRCPRCGVPLAYSAPEAALRCSYCSHREPACDACPSCQSTSFAFPGPGIEQVERRLRTLVPGTAVHRVGRTPDAALPADAALLLGTRAALGLASRPDVAGVVVVDADLALYRPDFRAGEQTFRLLAETAWRAGARAAPARVVIQTRFPEHPALKLLGAPVEFYQTELAEREQLAWPPSFRLALFTAHAPSAEAAEHAVRQLLGLLPARTRVYGPFVPFRAGSRRGARCQVVVKVPRGRSLARMLDRRFILDPRRTVDVCVDPLEIA